MARKLKHLHQALSRRDAFARPINLFPTDYDTCEQRLWYGSLFGFLLTIIGRVTTLTFVSILIHQTFLGEHDKTSSHVEDNLFYGQGYKAQFMMKDQVFLPSFEIKLLQNDFESNQKLIEYGVLQNYTKIIKESFVEDVFMGKEADTGYVINNEVFNYTALQQYFDIKFTV